MTASQDAAGTPAVQEQEQGQKDQEQEQQEQEPGRGLVRQPGDIGSGLVAAGGLLAVVAAVMTWDTLASAGERRAFSGIEVGDGRLTAAMGLGLMVLGVTALTRRPVAGPGRIAAALGLAVSALAVVDLLAAPPVLSSFRRLSADRIVVTAGAGLALTVVAGVVAMVGGWLAARSDRGTYPAGSGKTPNSDPP